MIKRPIAANDDEVEVAYAPRPHWLIALLADLYVGSAMIAIPVGCILAIWDAWYWWTIVIIGTYFFKKGTD